MEFDYSVNYISHLIARVWSEEEGSDPCMFCPQITKLFNLIALPGVILFYCDLTLLVGLLFLIDKKKL